MQLIGSTVATLGYNGLARVAISLAFRFPTFPTSGYVDDFAIATQLEKIRESLEPPAGLKDISGLMLKKGKSKVAGFLGFLGRALPIARKRAEKLCFAIGAMLGEGEAEIPETPKLRSKLVSRSPRRWGDSGVQFYCCHETSLKANLGSAPVRCDR